MEHAREAEALGHVDACDEDGLAVLRFECLEGVIVVGGAGAGEEAVGVGGEEDEGVDGEEEKAEGEEGEVFGKVPSWEGRHDGRIVMWLEAISQLLDLVLATRTIYCVNDRGSKVDQIHEDSRSAPLT